MIINVPGVNTTPSAAEIAVSDEVKKLTGAENVDENLKKMFTSVTEQTTITGKLSVMPDSNYYYNYVMEFKKLPTLIYFMSNDTFKNGNAYDVYYWGIILPKIKKMLGSFNHSSRGDYFSTDIPSINGNTVSIKLRNMYAISTAKSITYVAIF